MNRNRLHIAIIVISGWVICSLVTFSQILMATPTGGTIVEGSATIGVNPSNPQHQVITQTTPKAIIEWTSFNIGTHEITQFVQPSASAIVLNKVMGGDPSVILGTLKANGQVWLINPAGILFGQSAKVDVAGLLATTANISNQDFMKGQYYFLQPQNQSSSVINQGQIKIKDSGIAALVAPGAHNSGIIEANLGSVVLASGTEYTVDFYGDNLIHFAVGQSALTQGPIGPEGELLKDAVSNSGQIIANGGKVLLTTSGAKQIVENLINMDGIIKANTVEVGKGGKIILHGGSEGIVNVTGKIEAKGGKGQKGGEVTITGNKSRVGLFGTAEIDVSGEEGGGKVLVGGDFQGKGLLSWADATFMGKEAQIRADAVENGNGGTVVLWSKDSTRFYGDISAKGGKEGGNGGLGEISSRNWVDVKGTVNASAPKGLSGKLLVDPWDVLITNAAANGAFATIGGVEVWQPTGATLSQVDFSVIQNNLNGGTSVEIQTAVGTGADPGQPGGIVIDFGIAKTGGTACTLTLRASNNIFFGNTISDTTGLLTLVLIAAGTVSQESAMAVPAIANVSALQLNVGTQFDIGFPNNFPPANNPASVSTVNGNITGSNIVLLNTIGPGTHFFNNNDLFQYQPLVPPPPSTTIPINTINSVLTPNNLVPTSPEAPVLDPTTSVIETQAPPSQPPAPAPSGPTTPEAAPPPAAPEPSPAPGPEAAAPPAGPEAELPLELGTGDVPTGSEVIGGTPEGREPIQTAEAAEGREGFAEGAFEPEAMEQTLEVAASCPVNIEDTKGAIPLDCPEKPSGPMSQGTLADTEVGPDSVIAKEIQHAPIGPEGIAGVDVPMGAEGIGGSLIGQEQITTAEGAEGDERLLGKYTWSPEDIDLSPEYLENLGPERQSPLSFGRRRLFARLKIPADIIWS